MRSASKTSLIRAAALAVFVALTCAAGCSSPHPFGKPKAGPQKHVTITQSDEIMALDEDDVLVLNLPYRQGYEWTLSQKPDVGVLRPLRRRPGVEEFLGEPMTMVYFSAVAPGITSLELAHRPLAGGGPAIGRFGLTVKVSYDP